MHFVGPVCEPVRACVRACVRVRVREGEDLGTHARARMRSHRSMRADAKHCARNVSCESPIAPTALMCETHGSALNLYEDCKSRAELFVNRNQNCVNIDMNTNTRVMTTEEMIQKNK